MVYGSNLNNVEVKSPKLKVVKTHTVENSSCFFVDVDLTAIETGQYQLVFSSSESPIDVQYSILKRDKSDNLHQGFNNEDVIYPLMPDRFVNGDESNDFIEGYVNSFQNQLAQAGHGGDIQGVIDRLDYMKDLGLSTIWLTTLIENNTFRSYHGYSTTDFYNIDPRIGNINLYKGLVNNAHDKGLKIIMDHVSNHISINHTWMMNLPTSNWINGKVKNHLAVNNNKMVYTDPHVDSSTIENVYKGWFIDYMPDLNKANQFLNKYITQNTIWWV